MQVFCVSFLLHSFEMEVVSFPAIQFASQRGSNPVLVYRLPDDDSMCYKFSVKKSIASGGFYYECYGCRQAKKLDETLVKRSILSIKVTQDYLSFNSDPTLTDHFCETFLYKDIQVTQIYRYLFGNRQ